MAISDAVAAAQSQGIDIGVVRADPATVTGQAEALRAQLCLYQLKVDSGSVTIVRGAGPCFSAGYDLAGGPLMDGAPFYSAPGDGQCRWK